MGNLTHRLWSNRPAMANLLNASAILGGVLVGSLLWSAEPFGPYPGLRGDARENISREEQVRRQLARSRALTSSDSKLDHHGVVIDRYFDGNITTRRAPIPQGAVPSFEPGEDPRDNITRAIDRARAMQNADNDVARDATPRINERDDPDSKDLEKQQLMVEIW